MLTDIQTRQLEKQLHSLRSQISSSPLYDSGKLPFGRIAGEVHDSGDESIATETVELNATMADRRNQELKDIDAALQRIAENTYGICLDCGVEIDFDRLLAFPMAKRCFHCKSQFERTGWYRTQHLVPISQESPLLTD